MLWPIDSSSHFNPVITQVFCCVAVLLLFHCSGGPGFRFPLAFPVCSLTRPWLLPMCVHAVYLTCARYFRYFLLPKAFHQSLSCPPLLMSLSFQSICVQSSCWLLLCCPRICTGDNVHTPYFGILCPQSSGSHPFLRLFSALLPHLQKAPGNTVTAIVPKCPFFCSALCFNSWLPAQTHFQLPVLLYKASFAHSFSPMCSHSTPKNPSLEKEEAHQWLFFGFHIRSRELVLILCACDPRSVLYRAQQILKDIPINDSSYHLLNVYCVLDSKCCNSWLSKSSH